MDALVNFFNTLLGIEISIFGIISAVILVFIQLVYTNYTYKHIGHLLRNGWLVLFFAFSVLDLFLTATGSYLLSIAATGPVIGVITNSWYVLVCLLLIFVSISFFVTLIVQNISYLQPHRAIFLLSNSFQYEDIRDYLWHKYDLNPPFDLQVRINFDFNDGELAKKSEEERELALKKKEADDVRRLKGILKEIDKIKKRTANAEDPLLSIRDMMIQFIRRADLSSLTEAQSLLLSISISFINKVPRNEGKDWSANGSLAADFTQHIIELLWTLLEIAEKEGLESAKKIVLNVAYEFSLKTFELGYYSELDLLHKFLQKVADASIGKSTVIFQDIMEYYQKIGNITFDLIMENPPERGDQRLNILDNIFIAVGWLGERLLMSLPLEEAPLMSNYDYSTEYTALFNCLLSFDHRYHREQSGAYPLIYFDALFVVLKQLVGIDSKAKIRRLDENIYDIVYAFAGFAESAIKVGNSDGASLAALRVEEAYQEIKKAGKDDLARDTMKCLVRIGILAAGNKEILHSADFMHKSIDIWAADTLVQSGENIDSEVLDAYIHTYEVKNHDAKWEFITKLGKRLRTNFGLSFDPETGQRYQDDNQRQL